MLMPCGQFHLACCIALITLLCSVLEYCLYRFISNTYSTVSKKLSKLSVVFIGAESGGEGGDGGCVATPAVEKSAGDVPLEIIFQQLFLDTYKFFSIIQHFQNTVTEIPRRK